MTQHDWLDHKQLQIIKGIGATPGDTYSAENPRQVVNLMSGIISLEDWSPNIPAIKGGGVWASSPIADGRTLLAAPVGNVTEKMSIRIVDTSYLGVQRQLNALNQMVSDCRDFWQSDYQIDPVYLMWYANCGAGPQYAMIYNIELAPEYEQSPTPSVRINMTIEREPAWRGIPPGANPKIWTYEVNPSNPQFNVNTAALLTGSDHLITEVLNNKYEWSPAAVGLQTTYITKNYIDIPAALVPGDTDALVELSIDTSDALFIGKPINTYIGRTSKPLTGTGHDGVPRAMALNLNAGDHQGSGVLVKTAVGVVSGILSNNSAVTSYAGIRTVTGVDAAYVTAAVWGAPIVSNIIQLDRELYRGTYAVFVRAYNTSAAAPVVSDMKMRLTFTEGTDIESVNPVVLPEVYVPLLDNNIDYGITYMGTITYPFSERSIVSAEGYGRQIMQSTNNNMRVILEQQVLVATANRQFTLLDVMLIPMDEGMVHMITTPITGTSKAGIILDNTGHLARGNVRQVGFSFNRSSADAYITTGGSAVEVRGQPITLKPGTRQRLYFLQNYYISTAAPREGLRATYTVRMNIVPRWLGVRDS